MPHSPRVHDGGLWVLDAGSGHLCRIDPQTGRREDVAFCPGFLCGLTFTGHYAVLTASLPRYDQLVPQNALAKQASTKDHQGRGRFFPTRPTSDPLEFAIELITSLVPGRIGKVIAIAVRLVGASFIVLEWFQWMRR